MKKLLKDYVICMVVIFVVSLVVTKDLNLFVRLGCSAIMAVPGLFFFRNPQKGKTTAAVSKKVATQYVYTKFGTKPLYRIEGDLVYKGTETKFCYKLSGNKVFRGFDNHPCFRIEGNYIYRGTERTPMLRIKGSQIYEVNKEAVVYEIRNK